MPNDTYTANFTFFSCSFPPLLSHITCCSLQGCVLSLYMPQMHQFLKLVLNSGKISKFQPISLSLNTPPQAWGGKQVHSCLYLLTQLYARRLTWEDSNWDIWPKQPQIWALKKSARPSTTHSSTAQAKGDSGGNSVKYSQTCLPKSSSWRIQTYSLDEQESGSLSKVYLHSVLISLQYLLKIIRKLNIISLAIKSHIKL